MASRTKWQDAGYLTKRSGIATITGAAFSPDGKLLAYSCGSEQTIQLWDVERRSCLRSLQGHQGEIWALTFSPDGRFLASGSFDTAIRLWETRSGQCFATFQKHCNWVWALAFSPDGAMLASGDVNGTINLWQRSSGQCLRMLQGSPYGIVSLKFTPDGAKLLSSNTHGQVTVWNVNDEHAVTTIPGSKGSYWLRSAVFSPDGSFLAARSEETVNIWDVNSGALLHEFSGSPGPMVISWSAHGALLAYGTAEGTISLWEWPTRTYLATLHSDRPYERMNIQRVTGITEAQKASLKALGAIEKEDET